MINQKELKDLLHYSQDTGIFTWLKTGSGIRSSGIAGNAERGKTATNTYIVIGIKGLRYKAHRLAWMYMTGSFPKDQIDHIDGEGTNNSFDNLRDVTVKENAKNQSMAKNNTTGVIGVHWYKQRSKWRVAIGKNNKSKYIGCFDDLFEACCARKSAEIKHGYHINHGRE